MIQCKFCGIREGMKFIDGYEFDFYECEQCQSVMCHMCTETNMKGRDYCFYCVMNREGK